VLRPSRNSSAAIGGWLLVGIVAATYAAALRNGFIWDDDLHVTANPHIIGPLGLKEIWSTAAANYFPLVLTNFWVQHAFWDLHPFGYHAVTIAMHALATVALWRVLVVLRIPGAWLGAALWALHPVQVESVAWISELKNTQSAVFFFLSILYYVHWVDAPERRHHLVAALLCGVAAILSKPSTVMLPVALGLCAWWRRGRLTWRDLLPLAPFFVLAAMASGWTIWEQKFHSGAQGPEWSQGLAERSAIAGRIVWFYLGKLLWPHPLVFIYPRWQVEPGNALAYVPLVAALGITAALAWRSRGEPRPALLTALYFGALLFPVLGFFNIYFFRYSFVGDHFQYLASAGPLVLLAAILARNAGRALIPVGAMLLAGCAALSARQCAVYRNHESLWRDTMTRNPSARIAWVNLADTLSKQGRREEALAYFEHAVQMDPNEPNVRNDLGGVLLLLGRPAEALPHLERAAAAKPNGAEIQSNLGSALDAVGRRAEAIAHYDRAVQLDAGYASAQGNLAAALAEDGRFEEAARHFAIAVRLRPEDAAARDGFGRTLQRLGRGAEAIAQFEHTLRLKPDSADAHRHLGLALLQAGRPEDALGHLAEAARWAPDSAAAHGAFGSALVLLQRWAEAIPELERAIELEPRNAEAQRALGVALVNTQRLEAAVAPFEAALQSDPNSAETHSFLGQTLRALGREAEGRQHLQRAAELQRR
jgi:tetratricopeptide (TPR) repeat protein